MAKEFYIKFYIHEWLNDPNRLQLKRENSDSWLTACLFMRLSKSDRLSGTAEALADILSLTIDEFNNFIEDIKRTRTGDVTQSNKKVTLVSRRYRTELKIKKQTALRVKNFREKNNVTQKKQPLVTSYKLEVTKEEESTSVDSPKKAAPASPQPIATRIPKIFPITPDMWAWVLSELPALENVEDAHAKFVEHWTNDTGPKSMKVDWILAWKEGMKNRMKWQIEDQLKLKEELKNGTGRGNKYPGKRTDADVLAESADFYNKYPS